MVVMTPRAVSSAQVLVCSSDASGDGVLTTMNGKQVQLSEIMAIARSSAFQALPMGSKKKQRERPTSLTPPIVPVSDLTSSQGI